MNKHIYRESIKNNSLTMLKEQRRLIRQTRAKTGEEGEAGDTGGKRKEKGKSKKKQK